MYLAGTCKDEAYWRQISFVREAVAKTNFKRWTKSSRTSCVVTCGFLLICQLWLCAIAINFLSNFTTILLL